ncbi:ADP-glyceromanno-heptose 6-epimerase [Candidatus Schneideria nysicola]|uniref:ADP-glyceromanno-heptose 6-epimerase n=1 Tax=Candidatus Schneideria nysicola TaxID=1081631 RepID=UPI001CAA69BC|nr:ADP-glyceromanno-heptose 6-epimerase [Candidatus Schneideria nysicola]UAJ66236.1 ADP-glyceromanno-heptose 6-epimerase [Candidatus Schneideria nysicola]
MIVVTGGAGFIGSNIIATLNTMGYSDILVVDNLKNGIKYLNLVDLNITDFLDKWDFFNRIFYKNIFRKIDVVFHEGACSVTNEWNGRYMMKNNYQFSKNLLHFCVKYRIPFIYASSAAIYGNGSKDFIEEPQHERPLNIYGYSKYLFDQYVRVILPKVRSQICGLRYFNVYGPRESHKSTMASIIYHIYKQMISNQDIQLFIGSENFQRDFIHVSDIVSINLFCWRNNISGIFNCGTGIAESFQNVAEIILKNFNRSIDTIRFIPFSKNMSRKHYQTFTKANLNKLKETGYNKPFKTIKEGIPLYTTWLNQNKDILFD